MRGAEGVHHEHVAERRVLPRQRFVIAFFADIHAAVLEQHEAARCHIDAVEVIAHEWHVAAEQFRKARRDRRQRIRLAPRAFLRPTKMRHHHDRSTLLQCAPERRQGGRDALFGRDARRLPVDVLDRHVEVLADQHALAGEVEVGHAEDGHRRRFVRTGTRIVPPVAKGGNFGAFARDQDAAGLRNRLKAKPDTISAPPTRIPHSSQAFQSRCAGAGASAASPASRVGGPSVASAGCQSLPCCMRNASTSCGTGASPREARALPATTANGPEPWATKTITSGR